MNDALKIALIGAIAILAFDAISSVLAITFGLEYGWFALGSLALYILFGYLAAIRSKWFFGGAVGAFLGLIETSLGWAISWNIGPGKPDAEYMNFVFIAGAVAFVVIAGAVMGMIGGVLTLVKKRNV